MPGTLPPAGDPAVLVATRRELHRVAAEVVAPARVAATGNEIALEPRPGGFGTPPFPDGGEVRVEGTELVTVAAGGAERRRALDVDASAAAVLAAFWGFAAGLLEVLRGEARREDDASGAILWPEHFDVAIELGPPGRRATYGGSPGDEQHDLPYLYVAPWQDPPPGTGPWDAAGFRGAELGYAALAATADPGASALAWLRRLRDAL
ncbi:MAG TPA: hypothetical protein VLB47_08505 [Solirubrobacteraceae bacterium]|nr:hypothetical protein [Solirubrobacteraceae bacterium]